MCSSSSQFMTLPISLLGAVSFAVGSFKAIASAPASDLLEEEDLSRMAEVVEAESPPEGMPQASADDMAGPVPADRMDSLFRGMQGLSPGYRP